LRTITKKNESDTNPVIEKIVNAVRSDQKPNLTKKEKEIWDQFLCAQLIRTPDYLSKFNFDQILDDLIATHTVNSEEHKYLSDPERRDRHKQKIKNDVLKNGIPRVLEVYNNTGVCITKVASPRKSFIIGSLPIVQINYGAQNPFYDLAAGVWLPIAHDVAVTIYGVKGEEKLASMDDKKVRELNEAITRQSSVIAGRSKELIKSLASPR